MDVIMDTKNPSGIITQDDIDTISDLFLDISDSLTESRYHYLIFTNSYIIYGVGPKLVQVWPKIFKKNIVEHYTAIKIDIKIDRYMRYEVKIDDKLKSFLNRIPKFNYSFKKNEYTASRPSDLERETFIEISIIKNNI